MKHVKENDLAHGVFEKWFTYLGFKKTNVYRLIDRYKLIVQNLHDNSTAEFLRQKESNMRQIVGKAYTELGKELYEAQQRLAGNNQYDGVFNRWLDYMEYPRRTAYELIARYKELVRIPHKQKNIFEALPISLSKTISAKSSEDTPAKAQAKAEVLAGDIATLKEYRERIKELEKQAEAIPLRPRQLT